MAVNDGFIDCGASYSRSFTELRCGADVCNG